MADEDKNEPTHEKYFADQFDDQLIHEFYVDQQESTNQADVQ